MNGSKTLLESWILVNNKIQTLNGENTSPQNNAPLGASLHPWGLRICFGLERAGSLTQLGPVVDTSPMASGETGGLWNCCQKTQVYQGLTRTFLSIEQTQTYKCCLRSHPDPPNLHLWKQARWCLQSQEVCKWPSVTELRLMWISKFSLKVELGLYNQDSSRLERSPWACSNLYLGLQNLIELGSGD